MGRDRNQEYIRHDAKQIEEDEISQPAKTKKKTPKNFLIERKTFDKKNPWKTHEAFETARARNDAFDALRKKCNQKFYKSYYCGGWDFETCFRIRNAEPDAPNSA